MRIYISKVPAVGVPTLDRLAAAILTGGHSVTDALILADGVIFVVDRVGPRTVATIETMRAGTRPDCRIVTLLLADLDPDDTSGLEVAADGVVSVGPLHDRIAGAIAIAAGPGPASPVVEAILFHVGRVIQLPTPVYALAYGRFDGRTVLVVTTEDGDTRTVDPPTGEIVGTLAGRPAVRGVALADGGMAVGDAGGGVRWWRRPGAGPQALADHGGPVNAVAVGSVGGDTTVVSAGEARTLMVQGLNSSDAAAFLRGHTSAVNGLATGAVDGRPVVVSGSSDRTVRVWDLITHQQVRELRDHAGPVSSVAFGPLDGRPIAASGDGNGVVRVWDLKSGQVITVLAGHTGWVLAVAIAVIDARTVVISGGDDREVRLWDALTGNQLGLPLEHDVPVRALAVGELDGMPALFTGGENGEVRFWTAAPATGEAVTTDWAGLLLDSPSTEDLLGRRPLAQVLAQRIQRRRDLEPDTSILVHIDGPWGAGKTTLLEFLRSQLDEQHWSTVKFDAWREVGVGPAWWSLLRALRDAMVRERGPIGRLGLRLAEAAVRLRRTGASLILAVVLLIAVSGGAFFLFQPASLTMTSVGDMARTATAVLAALGTLGAGARLVARLLLWDSASGARLFERSDANPMQAVSAHFAWLMRRSRRPVMFMIDDLDRCPQAFVVEVLNAVQTLIRTSTPAASFVVAADGAWIRASYEVEYEKFAPTIAEPGRPLGHLFLDKLFQLHVPVPTIEPTRQRRYLGHLLGVRVEQAVEAEEAAVRERLERTTSETEIVDMLQGTSDEVRGRVAVAAMWRMNTPEITASTEHWLQRHGPLLQPNPRSMKLFLNTYIMLRTVRTLEGNAVPYQWLALWAVLETRWPSLADHLRRHPDHVDVLGHPDDELAAVPPGLRALFAEPAVRRVAEFYPEQPLTPEAVRSCSGAAGDV